MAGLPELAGIVLEIKRKNPELTKTFIQFGSKSLRVAAGPCGNVLTHLPDFNIRASFKSPLLYLKNVIFWYNYQGRWV